jgi:hypothetical protein
MSQNLKIEMLSKTYFTTVEQADLVSVRHVLKQVVCVKG